MNNSWCDDNDDTTMSERVMSHQKETAVEGRHEQAVGARAEASARGPLWADGWAQHKEDYDKGVQISPRSQLLSRFDALDVQKGEILANSLQDAASAAGGGRSTGCSLDKVANPHLRALVSENAEQAALAAEEMISLLNTNIIKKNRALKEFSETLSPGVVLQLATCCSIIFGVHGLKVCVSVHIHDNRYVYINVFICIHLSMYICTNMYICI